MNAALCDLLLVRQHVRSRTRRPLSLVGFRSAVGGASPSAGFPPGPKDWQAAARKGVAGVALTRILAVQRRSDRHSMHTQSTSVLHFCHTESRSVGQGG
jgi:hypothetical protein